MQIPEKITEHESIGKCKREKLYKNKFPYTWLLPSIIHFLVVTTNLLSLSLASFLD